MGLEAQPTLQACFFGISHWGQLWCIWLCSEFLEWLPIWAHCFFIWWLLRLFLYPFTRYWTKKLLRKLKCKSIVVSLGAFGALTPKYVALAGNVDWADVILSIQWLPSCCWPASCIWGSYRGQCSLVGQASEDPECWKASWADPHQEVSEDQDDKGLSMPHYRAYKMCRGPNSGWIPVVQQFHFICFL